MYVRVYTCISIYLRGEEMKRTADEQTRTAVMCHFLPGGSHSQGGVRPQLGVRNSVKVSHSTGTQQLKPSLLPPSIGMLLCPSHFAFCAGDLNGQCLAEMMWAGLQRARHAASVLRPELLPQLNSSSAPFCLPISLNRPM